jgi:hypothetical protein
MGGRDGLHTLHDWRLDAAHWQSHGATGAPVASQQAIEVPFLTLVVFWEYWARRVEVNRAL